MSINLQNSWMNNVDFLASMAHVGWAALIVVGLGFRIGHPAAFIAAAVLVGAAAVKEFFYDANYELPPQTWKDNLLDFSMYIVGIGLGLGVLLA